MTEAVITKPARGCIIKDISGKRFKHCTVISFAGRKKEERVSIWNMQCDCGKIFTAVKSSLNRGNITSCGCMRGRHGKSRRTHGHACKGKTSSEYTSWLWMRRRCLDKKCGSYPAYGGAGISVCESWSSFEAFLSDMGPKPTSKHTIDRKNNSLGYSPENCRWATSVEQANNRRTSRMVTRGHESDTAANWAAKLSIPYGVLYNAAKRNGWNIDSL